MTSRSVVNRLTTGGAEPRSPRHSPRQAAADRYPRSSLPPQGAQPATFRAEHQHDPVPKVETGERLRRGLVEPTAPKPRLLQAVEGARQIDDADQWHAVECAGRSLGERTSRRRRAMLADDDGA